MNRLRLWVWGRRPERGSAIFSTSYLRCILSTCVITGYANFWLWDFSTVKLSSFLFVYCTIWEEATLHWRLRNDGPPSWRQSICENYLKFCTGDLSLFLFLPLSLSSSLSKASLLSGTMRCPRSDRLVYFWPQFWIRHFSKKSVFLLLGKGIRNHCLSTRYAFCYCDIIGSTPSQGRGNSVYTNLCIHTSTNMCFTVCVCIKLNMRSYCLQH